MKRYRVVRRAAIVAAIGEALRRSGATVIRDADPTLAPFEFTIRTPSDEQLDLVCYAFLANRYAQGGRPKDEHRFQIKYGSDFRGYHKLFFDHSGNKITLLFGVHLERNLFVVVDPQMHNPTRFSVSVEFKEDELRTAAKRGWHGWQRDRSAARRKAPAPQENLQTEAVIAFRPEHFLRYVEFERVSAGLDTGERLHLSDGIETRIASGKPLRLKRDSHPLETQLGLPAREILDVIAGAFRLAAAVRGGVAEHHLERHLREMGSVTYVRHIVEDGKPDFEVEYKGRRFLIECKNVLARRQREMPKVDFQKTRASKTNPCSRYYSQSQFHVLAACLHPVTTKWEFRFTATASLAAHPKCAGRLNPSVLVEHTWPDDLRVILDSLCVP